MFSLCSLHSPLLLPHDAAASSAIGLSLSCGTFVLRRPRRRSRAALGRCSAFTEPPPYLKPGGTLVVMAGSDAEAVTLPGWTPPHADAFRRPLTGDGGTLLSYRKIGEALPTP